MALVPVHIGEFGFRPEWMLTAEGKCHVLYWLDDSHFDSGST